jgi:hypothetical protein
VGKIELTPEEKARLESEDFLVFEDRGAKRPGYGTYHNPVTGQEISHPTDPPHMTNRLRQGWRLGPASPELREKWKVRQAELKAEDDRRVEEYVRSNEGQAAQKEAFTSAVQTAVTAVLEQMGISPEKAGVTQAAPETTPAPVEPEPREGTQLPLWTADAPAETDTKLSVSEASRPDLRLVGKEGTT